MNHQKKALKALKAAEETPAEGTITDPWLLEAQVHATLALVEQQRIANLIALYAADTSEGLDALMHNTSETFGVHYEIRPEISEALGLGDTK